MKKIDTYHSNPEKSSTTKINKDTAFGFSFFTNCSFEVAKTSMIYIEARIA